jgi:hypothetical protein
VGGFGITRRDDVFLVENVRLVRQVCTPVSVSFDDAAVADFFDGQVDLGRQPREFARVWVHTHPACCAQPSTLDEETFQRCFGKADWSVMFVLAHGGLTYARLQFGVGPGGWWEIPVEVDYCCAFPAADRSAWQREYLETVQMAGDPLGRSSAERFPVWDPRPVAADAPASEAPWEDWLGGELPPDSEEEEP